MKFYMEVPEGFAELVKVDPEPEKIFVHQLNPDRYVQFLAAAGSDIWYFDILPINGEPTPTRVCASAEGFE